VATEQDPAKRPSIDEVVEHPWLASYQEELGNELDEAIAARIAAKRQAAETKEEGGKK